MTRIEWTEATWNPVTGCDRVSPGCDHCYALTLSKRLKAMGQPKYQADGDPRTSGPGFGITSHPGELRRPFQWRKPRLVFVNSMSDLFHRDLVAPVLDPDDYSPEGFPGFVWRVFETMGLTGQHTYQVLTKRPDLMRRWFASGLVPHTAWSTAQPGSGEWPLQNVWLGTSIESSRYTWRADHLRATPAAVRFLSLEPLLGPVPDLDLTGIDWVIVGAESGPGARPMDLAWAEDVRRQCAAAGVPLFVKQVTGPGGRAVTDLDHLPDGLQVREWPAAAPAHLTDRSHR